MKILTVLGTRPEIIRLCRVIAAARRVVRARPRAHRAELRRPASATCSSASSGVREPDVYLGVRGDRLRRADRPDPRRGSRRSSCRERPDRLLILGDTNSGLCRVRRQAPGHPRLPHGGRQPLLRRPRARGGQPARHRPLSSPCCMPYTERSAENLLREGIERQRIFVTGNPIKEVLDHYAPQIDASRRRSPSSASSPASTSSSPCTAPRTSTYERRLRGLVDALTGCARGVRHAGGLLAAPAHRATRSRRSASTRGRGRALRRRRSGFFDFVAPREAGVLRALRQRHRAGGVLHLRRAERHDARRHRAARDDRVRINILVGRRAGEPSCRRSPWSLAVAPCGGRRRPSTWSGQRRRHGPAARARLSTRPTGSRDSSHVHPPIARIAPTPSPGVNPLARPRREGSNRT